jgi:hypothetical protein
MQTCGVNAIHAQAPSDTDTQRMLRLEHFLDVVLRRELNEVLNRREMASATVAQCRQVRDLLDSIAVLGTATPPLGASSDALSTDVLTNIGNHFYMQCHVPDARTIHINIGCGVVLPMLLADAKAFLVKKEGLLVQDVERLTRESLRMRFRMRLVMEAISRLSQAPIARKA